MSQKTEVSAYLWLFPTRTSLRLVTWKKKISHMLYQLYYLLISFNLHNSFMKYLLFLLYDTCKIGLANWSWPKVKGKVSGGTRTKRRSPRCWAHYIWAKYSLPFLVSCLPFIPDLCAWGSSWQPAFPGLSCQWTPVGVAKQMRSEGRGEECEWKMLPAISANKACCAIWPPATTDLNKCIKKKPICCWSRKCNPLQYSYLENPMKRGAWWAPVHGVPQSWIWLSKHGWTQTVGS